MKKMYRLIMMISLLVLAIFFYSLGGVRDLFILLIIGFGFEVAFWLLAFKAHRKARFKNNQ